MADNTTLLAKIIDIQAEADVAAEDLDSLCEHLAQIPDAEFCLDKLIAAASSLRLQTAALRLMTEESLAMEESLDRVIKSVSTIVE